MGMSIVRGIWRLSVQGNGSFTSTNITGDSKGQNMIGLFHSYATGGYPFKAVENDIKTSHESYAMFCAKVETYAVLRLQSQIL